LECSKFDKDSARRTVVLISKRVVVGDGEALVEGMGVEELSPRSALAWIEFVHRSHMLEAQYHIRAANRTYL
jgi:hypothetical protein